MLTLVTQFSLVNRFSLTLRTRIYLSMLTLILITFISTGLTAYYNFKSENEEYQEQRLLRKEYAVEASINYFINNLGNRLQQDSLSFLLSDKICELAEINRIPISVYNMEGHLLISATSTRSPGVFLPKTVDSEAKTTLKNQNMRASVERIIDGETHSVLNYWTLQNIKDEAVAYIGVRYDKSIINKDEISDFLSNLTYMFIALFILASVLAFFISNYITKSLQKISAKMHDMKLGKKNEPIIWESHDEIGQLVNEYNIMLKKVEDSADLLKKSEREMAWREMAKQVAHEIKNPLTPMKLRVQHLKRAWSDQVPDFHEKLETVSTSLIEQIDALTNIANEFSNFAKMPKANNEENNLEDILLNTIELFKDSSNTNIDYDSQFHNSPRILADKDQISRVFINLLTNAIQAIPKEEQGQIQIRVKDYQDIAIIEIQDNGTGIKKEQEKNIFEPNFTTKTTGTGLGLAMVKNIVNNSGGDIWFKTELGKGTTFFVSFPLIKN